MAKKFIDVDKYRGEFVSAVFDILSEDENKLNANLIVDAFDDMPAAEVEPVRLSKWVADVGEYYCARCEYEMQYVTPYCPKCGCIMDGDNNDTQ